MNIILVYHVNLYHGTLDPLDPDPNICRGCTEVARMWKEIVTVIFFLERLAVPEIAADCVYEVESITYN